MGQDRTSEFLSLAQSLPNNNGGGGGGSQQPHQQQQQGGALHNHPSFHSQNTDIHSNRSHGAHGGAGAYGQQQQQQPNYYSDLRDFHTTASSISTDIAKTSTLLQELTQLVRRKNLFMDDTTRVNTLVLTIKHNVESLNGRLDEAQSTINTRRRRMGKNSQAGQEATNLVDQLREEFVKATRGFKSVLQARSDGMKETEGRKMAVFGGGGGGGGPNEQMGGGPQGGGGTNSMALGNRPPVYGPMMGGGGGGGGFGAGMPQQGGGMMMGGGQRQQQPGGFMNSKPGGGGGGLGGGVMAPTLDLTSAYMTPGAQDSGGLPAGQSTDSAGGLARPHGGAGVPPPPYGSNTYNTPSAPGGGGLTPPGLRQRTSSGNMQLPTYSGSQSTYNPNAHQQTPMTPIEIAQMEEASGQSQMMQLIPDQNYLRERADAMTTVESNIVELGTIFNKLAVMVSEHRELVQRVEDNVEETSSTLTLSLETLTDTLEHLRTNRALFMKVMGVLVIFIILFVTFFA